MFNELIISGSDQVLLANEMIKSGYGFYQSIDEVELPLDFKSDYALTYNSERVNNLLQMALLANKVYLTDLPPWYVLDELVKARLVEYDSYESSREKLGFKNLIPEIDSQYVEYIKPIVVGFLADNYYSVFFPPSDTFSAAQSFSIVFDYFYESPSRDRSIDIRKFTQLANTAIRSYTKKFERNLKMSSMDPKEFFVYNLLGAVVNSVEDIVLQLELSASMECPIIQDLYDFSAILSKQKYLSNSTMYAYKILRINCSDIIGDLPLLRNYNDVLNIKNHNANDLRRLRQVLSEFEERIRTDGKEKATKALVQDIKKASKELSKGNPLAKVSKFIQYLAVPVGVAEMLLSAPPIVGLSIEAIGQLTELTSNKNTYKNNWLNVVR